MPVEEQVIEKVHRLSREQQEEVLLFVEYLEFKRAEVRPCESIKGLWGDLDIELTEVDLAAARREMWGTFPREIPE